MICELATLKARLKLPDSDVVDDDLLALIIGNVSARFDSECNRRFARAAQVEEYQGDETELRVSRFPIESVDGFALKTSEADGWVEFSPDYVIRKASVISLRSEVGIAAQVLRVSYTGGYVLPGGTVGEGQSALPDDVASQALEQCVYLYQNKDRLGVSSLAGSGSGGSISLGSKLDLLPSVAAVLSRYERWMP